MGWCEGEVRGTGCAVETFPRGPTMGEKGGTRADKSRSHKLRTYPDLHHRFCCLQYESGHFVLSVKEAVVEF